MSDWISTVYRYHTAFFSILDGNCQVEYPVVEEQPPLAPVIEGPTGGPTTVQFVLGPPLMSRLWFLSEDCSSLVQLQPERLVVNWRGLATGSVYARYPQRSQICLDVRLDVVELALCNLQTAQLTLAYELGHIEPASLKDYVPSECGVRTAQIARIPYSWRNWTPRATSATGGLPNSGRSLTCPRWEAVHCGRSLR
jgi:hypothetical protein